MGKLGYIALAAIGYYAYTQMQKNQALTQERDRLSTLNRSLQTQIDALRINTPNTPNPGVTPTRDAGVTGA